MQSFNDWLMDVFMLHNNSTLWFVKDVFLTKQEEVGALEEHLYTHSNTSNLSFSQLMVPSKRIVQVSGHQSVTRTHMHCLNHNPSILFLLLTPPRWDIMRGTRRWLLCPAVLWDWTLHGPVKLVTAIQSTQTCWDWNWWSRCCCQVWVRASRVSAGVKFSHFWDKTD